MKILVYGAGNIGQLYAARLADAGHDVSILARGRRLDDIRENGIRLEKAATGERSTHRVTPVADLAQTDAYELVIVALPGSAVASALPTLATHQHSPSVLFFGNTADGPRPICGALGPERVLLGFPGAAAIRHEGWLRYVVLSARQQPTTIGEVDGQRTARVQAIAEAIGAAGFPTAISKNMDAWLKTHAAEIVPTAQALYAAGLDVERLTRTPDALLLMVRAIRENFDALSANGVPITPHIHRIFRWLPEPVLVAVARRAGGDASAAIQIGHARAARDEMRQLDAELETLARRAGVDTPANDRLRGYTNHGTDPMPEGRADLRLARGGLFAWVLAGLAMVAAAVVGALA